MSGASRAVADGLGGCRSGRNGRGIFTEARPTGVEEQRADVLRRALMGESAADEEPLRVVLRPDAARDRVSARPR